MLTFFRRVWILVVLWGFSLSPPAHSQSPPSPLALEDCVRLAESAPSAVRLAKQQRDIANLELKQAQAAFLPRTQLGSGFTYNSPLRENSSLQSFSFVALNGVHEYVSLLSASQELDVSGRLRADRDERVEGLARQLGLFAGALSLGGRGCSLTLRPAASRGARFRGNSLAAETG